VIHDNRPDIPILKEAKAEYAKLKLPSGVARSLTDTLVAGKAFLTRRSDAATPAVVSVNTITLPFTLCQHLTSLLHLHIGDTIVWEIPHEIQEARIAS
jgi:hypothetical protein